MTKEEEKEALARHQQFEKAQAESGEAIHLPRSDEASSTEAATEKRPDE